MPSSWRVIDVTYSVASSSADASADVHWALAEYDALDLFGRDPKLDLERARASLVELPHAEVTSISDATLALRINDVPVDVVRYPYGLLNPTTSGPNEFPVASVEDVVTMKLSAAARRGSRRDFWDLFEIF
jgi:hypothetical protein